MKKNKILMISFSSLVLLGLAVNHVSADTDVSSNADVGFKANNGPVNPVDPGGDEDIDPNLPPTDGPLSINYASNLVFGQQKKTLEEQVFYASEDTITISETGIKKQTPNFVQVTDLRGTATGWSLLVKQNGPLKKENGVAIVGGKLTLSARSIKSVYDFKEVPSGLATNVVLSEDGQSHEIVKAEAGTGISTWSAYLGNAGDLTSGASLTVPNGAVKETGIYSTSLTWVLQDVL